MKFSELPPNNVNPRKISKKQLENLRRSIETYGDLSCIIFNRRTRRLVAGNQRQKVLGENYEVKITKEFEIPNKQGTVALGHVSGPFGVMAYREVIWSDEDEKLAGIAANNLTGDNDNAILKEELLYLDAHNMDLELTGLDASDIERILGLSEKKEKELTCPHCHKSFTK